MSALVSFLDALRRRGSSWEKIASGKSDSGRSLAQQMQPIFTAARRTAGDDAAFVDRADVALYRAKEEGRNGVQPCLRSTGRTRTKLRLAPRVEAARFGFGR